jgi:peroxiredoxin Q/BCP
MKKLVLANAAAALGIVFFVPAPADADDEAKTPAAPLQAPGPATPPAAPPPAVPEPVLLPVGAPAPDFTVEAHTGAKVQLSKLKGKFVILYWYPKDDTPGCTKEACDFRDSWARLQAAGVKVFGLSGQDNASHKAFAEKHQLPFPLLPDQQGEIAKKYNVPMSAEGKAKRITYLIGKDGKVMYVWPKVTPVGHAAEILAQIERAPKAPGKARP